MSHKRTQNYVCNALLRTRLVTESEETKQLMEKRVWEPLTIEYEKLYNESIQK